MNTTQDTKFQFNLPHQRLAKTASSFTINCIKCFNKLPKPAYFSDFQNFKTKVMNRLQNNPFYSIKKFLESTVDLNSSTHYLCPDA